MKENIVEKYIEILKEMNMKNKLKLAIKICENFYSNMAIIEKNFWCDYGYNISSGENFHMNHNNRMSL